MLYATAVTGVFRSRTLTLPAGLARLSPGTALLSRSKRSLGRRSQRSSSLKITRLTGNDVCSRLSSHASSVARPETQQQPGP